MKLKTIPSILLLMLCFSVSIVLIGCTEESDDDDNSLNCSGNGWSGGGCDCSREGGEEAAGFIAVTDPEDCIPPLPDERYRESLEVLLNAYLGTYEDQDGKEKQILCRPEGKWSLASKAPENSLCADGSWGLPVWVIYDLELDPIEGYIERAPGNLDKLPPDPTRFGDLSFRDAEENYFRFNQDDGAEVTRWSLTEPRELDYVWTKVSGL